MNDFTPEQLDYLNWIKRTLPQFYADVVQPKLNNVALGSIGNPSALGGFTDILNSITGALPSLASSYASVVNAQTQAELQSRTAQIAQTTRATSANHYLPWILGGGAALVLLLIAMR